MIRLIGGTVALVGLMSVSAPASAASPYMWGIGPKIGTTFLPARYPYAFPPTVAGYDFIDEGANAGNPDADDADRDLNDAGEQRFSTLSGVPFDLRFGGEGFYGIDGDNRVGAGVGIAGGNDYIDYWFTLNYDRRLVGEAPFDLLLGAQIGFGNARWDGDEELPGGENESMAMTYYPLRVRLTGQFRDGTRMYGLGIFVQDAVPSNTTYIDLDGNEQESVGGPANFIYNLAAGIEIDVQFGDFTPPRKKRPGGRAPAPAPSPSPVPKKR